MSTAAVGAAALAGAKAAQGAARTARKPNIVFILADDLGYGDLGCYGQQLVLTPRLDRMAADGIRFTQCYAGSTVCAPSRSCLMTGLHTGHTHVRGNSTATDERIPLRPDDTTVAETLKGAGYATGLVGKWGLGEPGTTGIPNRKGFDYFYGYLNQGHAHDYYPEYLWRNEERVALEGNTGGRKEQYSHDLCAEEALAFVERHQDDPFFLYLSFQIPHAHTALTRTTGNGMETPDDAPYSDRPWTAPNRNFAAMITRMDRDIGRLLDRLQALGLDDDTLVIFSSDNGPHRAGGNDPEFFRSAGPLRGIKRDLYEGGIRVPFIVRWPGRIAPGTVSRHVGAFWDFLPTAADLAGAPASPGIDGVSMLPALLGGEQREHDHLYWEFHERRFCQAVRIGDWKAVRLGIDAPIELYNLAEDIAETRDVAAENPDIVARARSLFDDARTESEHWPVARGGSQDL